MNLVVFGVGYSALSFLHRHAAAFTSVSGTVRHPAKAATLAQSGISCFVFDSALGSDDLRDQLRRADAVLVSIPPSAAGEPTLTCFADALRAAPHLDRIVYLSTIGVYGDHGGRWVDETTVPRPVNPRSVARLAAEAAWQN